jgi:nicotinamidase-related amidase
MLCGGVGRDELYLLVRRWFMERTSIERVLLDIETQRDFFCPGGSCYSSRALKTLKGVYELFDWARRESIPVLSTVLRVRPHTVGPLASVPHCQDGSWGEEKLPRTALPHRLNMGLLNTTDLPNHVLTKYPQVIIEKRETDLFAHARAERLITELPHTTFVICGAGLAKSIAQAAIGLRIRGFGVIVADDAILDLSDPGAPMARSRMEAKGVVFAPTQDVIAPRPRRRPTPLRALEILQRMEAEEVEV